MKQVYIKPELDVVSVRIECHLCKPSTWSVDDGPKIPIVEANTNDPEEPTGAKWYSGVSVWED